MWVYRVWRPAVDPLACDVERAYDLMNCFTAAFLMAEMYGVEDVGAAAAPDSISLPGIGYEDVGYCVNRLFRGPLKDEGVHRLQVKRGQQALEL